MKGASNKNVWKYNKQCQSGEHRKIIGAANILLFATCCSESGAMYHTCTCSKKHLMPLLSEKHTSLAMQILTLYFPIT